MTTPDSTPKSTPDSTSGSIPGSIPNSTPDSTADSTNSTPGSSANSTASATTSASRGTSPNCLDLELTAENLSVGFDKQVVAKEIGLVLHPGEVVAIAGPNGVGKSTLVKTLARQIRPLSGRVKLGNIDIWQMPPSEFASKVAYVGQVADANVQLTVAEVVALGRNPHQNWWQWGESERDRQSIEHALDVTGLAKFKDKYVTNLSGGERQRAAIATALAQEPIFMILDEPTSFLDFRHQLELIELLQNLRNKKLSIVLVLHDLNLMKQLADRVLLLQSPDVGPSVVAGLGAAEKILDAELLKQVFGVSVHTAVEAETGKDVIFYEKI
jgi:iron complex transport system ATP-binding protein